MPEWREVITEFAFEDTSVSSFLVGCEGGVAAPSPNFVRQEDALRPL